LELRCFMFTGIVEAVGEVVSLSEISKGTYRLEIKTSLAHELKIGESVSNNGCCLTVVSQNDELVGFDMVAETASRSNLSALKTGDLVNQERSMLVSSRIDGHLVQGHVDSTARILQVDEKDEDRRIVIELPKEFRQYVVFKGSIAVNGISLTVSELRDESFVVAIIPHTWTITNLHHLRRGDSVNLEFDLIAKYVERMIRR
jgi:riboflavin synthase